MSTELNRPAMIGYMARDEAQASFVMANQSYIEDLPFDGIVIRDGALTERIMAPDANAFQGEDVVRQALSGLADLNSKKQNHLLVQIDEPGDLFDDAAWARAVENWKTTAKVAKEVGFKGFLFDIEEYEGFTPWLNFPEDYTPEQAARGLEAYQAKASQRGKEIMEAINEVWPDGSVTMTFGPFLSDQQNAPEPLDFGASYNNKELAGAFFTGFAEGKGEGQSLIDGGELYSTRTRAEFEKSVEYRSEIMPGRMSWDVDPEVLENWGDLVSEGHLLYTGDFRGRPAGPEVMERAMSHALSTGQDAVFLYTDGGANGAPGQPNLYKDLPDDWRTAIENAISNAENGIIPIDPGVPDFDLERETVSGTAGNDTIESSDKDENLSGGDGDDMFRFEADWGRDVITDFHFSGDDTVEFKGVPGFNNFDDLTILSVNGDAVIEDGRGNQLVIKAGGGRVDASDFIFTEANSTPETTPPKFIFDTAGSDILHSTTDDEVFTVRAGNDTVILSDNWGNDRVIGYKSGEDKIAITTSDFATSDYNDFLINRKVGLVNDPNKSFRLEYNGNSLILNKVSDVLDQLSVNLNTHLISGTGAEGEVLFGTSYGDTFSNFGRFSTLFGDDGNDVFYATGNHSTIYAGDGEDMVDYTYSTDAMMIDLNIERAHHSSALGGGDILLNIEHVTGSGYSDDIFLNSQDNIVDGGFGADRIYFNDDFGQDSIRGFEDGIDKIYFIEHSGVNSIDDLTITDRDGHAYIEDNFGNSIMVELAAGQIDASDFVF